MLGLRRKRTNLHEKYDYPFHATLFQFTSIVCCPIHRVRLHETCPSCRQPIAYRMTAGFAAEPLACPECAHPFLPDPTVLARQCLARDDAPLSRWQHYLAHYAYWFANGHVLRRDEAGRFLCAGERGARHDDVASRLSFIATLQGALAEPPPLPLEGPPESGMPPTAVSGAPPALLGNEAAPPFSREEWPHFHSRDFLALYERYAVAMARLQQDHGGDRRVLSCWRRTWEGAIARRCDASDVFRDPPFGVAEWLAYAPRPEHDGPAASLDGLVARFAQDLRMSWVAWLRLLQELDADGCRGLAAHPRLVPPRACWLGSPSFGTESPALGFR